VWGSGWEEDFWKEEDDPVFLPTLTFLCFFCFMLICQLVIGGQKGGGFCHHRIEVISKKQSALTYTKECQTKEIH